MKEKLKELAGALLGYSVVAVVILAVIAAIAVVSGSIMRLFGFEYRSVWSIILFFIIVMIVGFPLEVLSSALPAVFADLGRCTQKQAVALYVIMDTLFSAVSMAAVDRFMDSVSASDLSILVISFLFAVTSIKDFKEKLGKDR